MQILVLQPHILKRGAPREAPASSCSEPQHASEDRLETARCADLLYRSQPRTSPCSKPDNPRSHNLKSRCESPGALEEIAALMLAAESPVSAPQARGTDSPLNVHFFA